MDQSGPQRAKDKQKRKNQNDEKESMKDMLSELLGEQTKGSQGPT